MKTRLWQPSCSTWTDGQTDRQTDRHGEPDSRFSQYCERAKNLRLLDFKLQQRLVGTLEDNLRIKIDFLGRYEGSSSNGRRRFLRFCVTADASPRRRYTRTKVMASQTDTGARRQHAPTGCQSVYLKTTKRSAVLSEKLSDSAVPKLFWKAKIYCRVQKSLPGPDWCSQQHHAPFNWGTLYKISLN